MTFDAATTVTTRDQWLSDPRWQRMGRMDDAALRGLDQLIVFAAHPDDETLGVGGLLAMAGELSLPVRIVVATGEDPRRHDELRAALDELGVSAQVDFLGFPDGALKHHAEALAAVVAEILDQNRGLTWAIAPWAGDRHGDHRTLGREVANAPHADDTTLFFYPVWLWQWATRDECPWDRMREVTMTEGIRRRKQSALEQFVSQIQSSANIGGILTQEFLGHSRSGREVLIMPPTPEQQPPTRSLEEHFELIHAEHSDPWSVRTRWYERRKRAITMASLPRERFSRVLEIGCSIGEISAELVERCDSLLAIDGSDAAVTTARVRLRDSPTATVQRMRVPHDWPAGAYDLIVVSEVAYYLAEDEWRETIRRCTESLSADGAVLLCHWLGTADDFAQTGEQTHDMFRGRSGLAATIVHRDEEFLLEIFEKQDGSSHA